MELDSLCLIKNLIWEGLQFAIQKDVELLLFDASVPTVL